MRCERFAAEPRKRSKRRYTDEKSEATEREEDMLHRNGLGKGSMPILALP